MELGLFESILFLSLQEKIDVKNWHAEDLFDLSSLSFLCSQWWISATTPKCSKLNDQKTGVIDEFTSDIDTLLIDDMYFLWLLE